MQQKDKKGEFSIRTTLIKWLNIQGLDSALFLFGNTYTGKSTICHLTKRVIDNCQDPNLKLVQKKKDFEYEYEGEINPKSTKPLTIYPKLFKIQTLQTNIVEVPSRIYQLQKKRPYLDKLLNLVGLACAAKKAKFLFCIDTKNTTGRVDPWKKSFQSIFDCFPQNFFGQNMLNSMGFIITKAANNHNKQTYLSRMLDIYQLFNEDLRKDLYLNLLKTIQTKKRVEVFAKISGQEGAYNDIKQISKLFQSLQYCNLSIGENGQNQHNESIIEMDRVNLAKDQQTLYNKFLQPLQLILEFFGKLFVRLFTHDGAVDIGALLQEKLIDLDSVLNRIKTEQQKFEGEESKVVSEEYNYLKGISIRNKNFYQTALGRASLMIEYKQRIANKNQMGHRTLRTFLEILASHGLILQDFQQRFKPIYLQLIIFQIFQERFGPLITNVDFRALQATKKLTNQFRQLHEDYVREAFLEFQFSQDQTPSNAKKILTILHKLFPQQKIKNNLHQQKVALIKNIMMLSSFDTKHPEKSLPQIFQLLLTYIDVKQLPQIIYSKQLPNPVRQIEFLNKLALLLAEILKNYGRSDLCGEIFKDCGQYYSAKVCLEIKLKQLRGSGQRVQKEAIETTLMSYLDLLMQMSLSQKALECCFQYSQVCRQLAPQLLGKMKEIKDRKSRLYSEQFQRRFTRKGVDLIEFYKNSELLQKIRGIVAEIRK